MIPLFRKKLKGGNSAWWLRDAELRKSKKTERVGLLTATQSFSIIFPTWLFDYLPVCKV